MSKKYTLISLVGSGGTYRATMQDENGAKREKLFMGYTKKEVYKRLRNVYGCTVGRSEIK